MAGAATRLLFQGSAVAPNLGGKIVDRLKAVADDYRHVFVQMGSDAKAQPFVAGLKLFFFGGSIALYATNEGEREFKGVATEYATAVGVLSSQERNEKSASLVHRAFEAASSRKFQRVNCFLFSLFLEEQHNQEVCQLYDIP